MNRHVKRIGLAIVVLVVATTITFILYRMMPGGPIDSLVSQEYQRCLQTTGDPSKCDLKQIRENVESKISIDPDKPILIAYGEFLTNVLLRQELGRSTAQGDLVFTILFKAMPWSIFISLYGLAFGWAFNIFWGAALAYKEGTRFDKGGTIFAMVGNSIPYYVAAILALAFLAYELGIFPQGGRYQESMALVLPVVGEVYAWTAITPGFNVGFMISALWSASLPIFTGFVLGISGLAMRGNAIRVLGSDYLRVARLRGLSQSRIVSRYIARNAILPMYTSFMIGIAGIFGSSIITERIFNYPAVGWYTFGALLNRDYPLLMGAFLFYTTITIIGITLAEYTYGMIDPRAKGGDHRESF